MSTESDAGPVHSGKWHKCDNCGDVFECKTPTTCDFGKSVSDCTKCYKQFSPDKMFVQQFPDSKYLGPKGIPVIETSDNSEPVEVKRDSQESKNEL